MLSKKALAGIAIVAILAVVVIAASMGSSGPNAHYNYDIELTDTFVDEEGFIERPIDGMQWAILSYTVTNDGYSPYVSTNPLTWEWTLAVNGLTYTYTSDSYSHPGYDLKEVRKGETDSQTLVFSIPVSFGLSDITVSQDYTLGGDDFERDGSIKVVKVTRSPQTYRYDYSLEFISDSALGPYSHPDSGMRFLKVTYAIANDSVTGGVSMGAYAFDWSVQIGGLQYGQSTYYSTLVSGYSDATVIPGGNGSSACIIQVPIGSSISDMRVVFGYDRYNEPLAVFDDTLL